MSCHLIAFLINFSPPSIAYPILSNTKRYVRNYQLFIHTSKQSSNEQPISLFKQSSKQASKQASNQPRKKNNQNPFKNCDNLLLVSINFLQLLRSPKFLFKTFRVSQINPPMFHLHQPNPPLAGASRRTLSLSSHGPAT